MNFSKFFVDDSSSSTRAQRVEIKSLFLNRSTNFSFVFYLYHLISLRIFWSRWFNQEKKKEGERNCNRNPLYPLNRVIVESLKSTIVETKRYKRFTKPRLRFYCEQLTTFIRAIRGNSCRCFRSDFYKIKGRYEAVVIERRHFRPRSARKGFFSTLRILW